MRRILFGLLLIAGMAVSLSVNGGSASQPDWCFGLTPTQSLNAPGTLIGTNGDDVFGSSGADVIKGKGGDDIICGYGGADQIDGGTGSDRLQANGGFQSFLVAPIMTTSGSMAKAPSAMVDPAMMTSERPTARSRRATAARTTSHCGTRAQRSVEAARIASSANPAHHR